MKRTPLKRKTPLKTKTGLKSRSSFQSQSLAEIKAVSNGEISHDEAFGPSMDIDQLRAWFDELHPGMPHRYRLPKHLHWMGPR